MDLPNDQDMVSRLKSGMERIPIKEVINLSFKSAGGELGGLHALVASSDYTNQTEPTLVYVEMGSKDGKLALVKIPKEPIQGLPKHYHKGYYDRDTESDEISAIYLNEEDVIPGSYQGTLNDLLNHPNIHKE